jgi:TolB-like protein/Tfp pilus assembly protein PilF
MPDETASGASRAVFLSYSREDVEPARRIADALRAFGIEVWFDQNELRGGDSWDAKIKKQIRECAIFVPIISARTQERMEGYFRREWKLGVERTHDMAAGVAFIVPVVIDETPESAATVPEEFMRVQWTRLAHGVPTPDFVSHMKRLLEAPPAARKTRAATLSPFAAAPAAKPAGMPRWAFGVLGAVVAGVAVAVLVGRKPAAETPSPVPAATAPAPTAAPILNEKSVAVLPFENMSEEKDENAFFADGVQDDILTNLSFIKDLRVVSRTSVMQYRGTTKAIGQIARELGVAYILEGSVRRAGNKVRVTGQLIHAATDEHVWAKAYDRDLTDVFAIQSELAQAIADALQAAISPSERTLLDRKPTANTAAYDLFLKARDQYETTSTTISITTANDLLTKAVQLDPGFAQAWALMGSNHAFLHFNENDGSPERLAKATAAIENALKLAPDDPWVIEMHGDYYYYAFRDYAHAAGEYERLLAQRPNSVEAVGSLALIYRRQGRYAEATEYFRRAIALDPRSHRYLFNFATFLGGLRRFDESFKLLDQEIALGNADLTKLVISATRNFYVDGSTAEGDQWFASYTPKPEERDEFTAQRRSWARLKGDMATAYQIDQELPYYKSDNETREDQELDTAFDLSALGNSVAARSLAQKLEAHYKEAVAAQPDNASMRLNFAFDQVLLGNHEAARAAADRALQLVPESVDRLQGPTISRLRAIVLALTGDKEGALQELARLLKTPFGSFPFVELHDSGWRLIRDDPRFKALMSDPANNAPLG